MALRDPGPPRRNPLFSVEEPPPEPEAGPAGSHDDDGWDDWADDPIFGGAGDPLLGAPGSAVGPLISALSEAGPEAAEHLVNAAHELTLAIKVVVDAFERSLAEQRATFAAEHATAERAGDDPERDRHIDLGIDRDAEPPDAEPPADRAGGATGGRRVQNIDLE
jgi:hypothetical protein